MLLDRYTIERFSQLALRIMTLEPYGLILLEGYTIDRVSQLVPRIMTLEPDGLILYAAGQVYYREGYSASLKNKDSGT